MSAKDQPVSQLKQQQRVDWDAAAAGWKRWWTTFEHAAQHISDRLVELAAVRPGYRVADLATGIGEPAITAARRAGTAGRVVAIDQSPGMLAVARERAECARPRTTWNFASAISNRSRRRNIPSTPPSAAGA